MFVYLDNSATTKQHKRVTEKMVECIEKDFGNPSSMHSLGVNAERLLKESRKKVSDSLDVNPEEIYFNSGGTESDNTAILGAALSRRKRGNKIITSKVEHPAVLESCKKLEKQGFEVVYLNVDENCNIDIEQYKKELSENVILITIMTANNEVGTIEPISEMYKLKNSNAIFHTDAVQAYGKVKVPLVDMISLSGHKVYGPKGIGALYVKRGLNIEPFIVGGGQEKNFRSGTENLPGIVGLGEAATLINYKNNMGEIKTYLKNGILSEVKDIKINSPENSVDSILNISFLGTRSEVILHRLEMDNIYVSAGSACSSHKKTKSHVLSAMGLKDNEIEGTIRFSFSVSNTIEEMDYVIDKVKIAVNSFRRLGSFR